MAQAPDWLNYVGVLALLVALVPIWQHIRKDRKEDLKTYLSDPDYRADLITRHDCTTAQGYYLSLARLLNWAQRFYGNRFSWKAFSRCLTLAYFYPLLAALIGWVALNQTAPGGVGMFADVPNWIGRFWRAGVAVLGFAAIMFLFPRIFGAGEKLRNRITSGVGIAPHWAGLLPKAAQWGVLALGFLVEWSAFAFALAVAVAVSFAIAIAVSGADAAGAFASAVGVAFIVAGAGAFAGAVAVAGAFAGAVAVAGAFAFVAGVAGDVEEASLILFLYALLPTANALADWLSLAVTRWLLHDMESRRPGAWGLVVHMGADLAAGIACLSALLAALVGMLELWAWAFPTTVPFDWRAYWDAAMVDPAQGLALWLMCFTTLLPTLVHLVWALTVWQTQKSERTAKAVQMMRSIDGTPSDAQKTEIAGLIQRGQLNGFLRAAGLWTPPLIIVLALVYKLIAA
ncbi:MAG: hypothetical protein QNJ09_07720 [Paracoccaceae bacterium]|nr:hypothetical protein [Paracoccaceae bacterium]